MKLLFCQKNFPKIFKDFLNFSNKNSNLNLWLTRHQYLNDNKEEMLKTTKNAMYPNERFKMKNEKIKKMKS